MKPCTCYAPAVHGHHCDRTPPPIFQIRPEVLDAIRAINLAFGQAARDLAQAWKVAAERQRIEGKR